MSPLRLIWSGLIARKRLKNLSDSGSANVSFSTALVLIVLILAAPFSISTAEAQEKRTRYCYKTCFYTLHEAEAELRANTAPYGALWRKEETSPTTIYSDTDYVIRYVLDDQPASVMYPAGYTAGGNGALQGICSPVQSPLDKSSCADEDEAVNGMIGLLQANAPNCVYSKEGYTGSHGEPYVHSRDVNGHGQLSFSSVYAGGIRKAVKYSVWCPGWGTPNPDHHELAIVKSQYFECQAGFVPKHADNPAYVPGAVGLQWPRLCRPARDSESIRMFEPVQTDSCKVSGFPCYPATGDKARVEVDFIFAGREFTRYYHSLGQVQLPSGMGANWSHSYSDKAGTYFGNIRYTESGYIQSYSGSRGEQATGEVFRRLTSGDLELLTESGSTRRYNSQGKLLSRDEDKAPFNLTFAYNSTGRLDRVVDGTGRTLLFAYEGGNIASITLPDGSQATYTYDEHNNLVKVVRPDGTSRSYVYAEPGLAPVASRNLLTGIIEEGVRYASFSYNDDVKVTGSHLFDNGQPVEVTTVSYNADGSATSTSNLGDARQHAIGGERYRQITQTSDAAGTSSYGFSATGSRTYKVDRRGNRVTYAYTNSTSGAVSQVLTTTEESIGRITRTTRDANNRVVEERVTQKVAGVEQLASLHRTVPDAQGRPLYTCQYDATQPTDYVCGSLALAPSNVRQTQHLYCTEADVASNPGLCPIVGLHRSTRDPAGNLTQFEYYAANDPGCDAGTSCTHRKGDLRAQINALGQRTEILEYDAAGNAIRIQAIDGTETERLYDSMGRMVTETLKGDVPANDHISLFEYSSTGKMTKSTGPDGVWTRMHYDTADRLTSVEDALGNRIVYTLDGAGNRVKEEIRDTAGALRKVMNRSFDTASRNTRIAGADGYATLLRYDGNGNVLESENAHGTITKQTYDGADRVLTEVQDLGGINAQVGYEYASNGKVAAVTDPKGLRTTYGYNGLGDQISLVSPDTGTTSFTVDINGNRKTKTDARGITATYHYDALNRLIGIGYPDPNLDVGYAYDTAPDVCAANERFAAGRVGHVQHEGGSTAYCYDRFGQLTRKVQTVNGVATTVRYAYTPGGRLAQLTYPDGSVADYQRDTLGRISEVGVTRPGQARQVVVTNVTYAPFGPATGWVYGNGRAMHRPVDRDYRFESISDSQSGGLKLLFNYDQVGAIAELTDGAGDGALMRYSYDALGHLVRTEDGGTGVPIEKYAYDATGNRMVLETSAGTQIYSYSANSHHLLGVEGEPREYDAVGNTLSIGDRQLAYSDANRLSRVGSAHSWSERYAYNHRGERIESEYATGVRRHAIHDELGRWVGSFSDSGQLLQQAVWMDGNLIALLLPYSESPSSVYVQTDHLGTPRAVIDPERDVEVWKWSIKSEVFGNQQADNDPDGDGVAFAQALRFPGQQAATDGGLFYNYHRDYDPASGRYIQSDASGLLDGPSTYGYVHQNPLSLIDPQGGAAHRPWRQDFNSLAEQARAEAIVALERCKAGECDYMDESYRFSSMDIAETLIKVRSAVIVFDPATSNCGYVESIFDSNRIFIGPNALSGVCCPLNSVIGHEASHLGRDQPGGRGTEKRARSMQKICFGCEKAFK